MRSRLFGVVAGAVFAVAAAVVPVMAHHSFAAEFDAKKPVKLRGTVTKMEWINPHSWIHIDVKTPDGKVEQWMVEGGAPNALLRRGWNKNSLLPGSCSSAQVLAALLSGLGFFIVPTLAWRLIRPRTRSRPSRPPAGASRSRSRLP